MLLHTFCDMLCHLRIPLLTSFILSFLLSQSTEFLNNLYSAILISGDFIKLIHFHHLFRIRTVYPEVSPRVEYSLSELGLTLKPILDSMVEWGTPIKKCRKNFLFICTQQCLSKVSVVFWLGLHLQIR